MQLGAAPLADVDSDVRSRASSRPARWSAQRGELGDDGAVAAGGVGLALERAQLAAHLAEQVLQPGEVALGGGEPALGLLLAPPELQDARRPPR